MDDWDDPLMTWPEWCCFAAFVLFVASVSFHLCGYGFDELIEALRLE